MTIRTAPGPRGGPIVGSALEIGRDPLRAYTRYARTYGDVVSARFLRWRLQFFFHPEHVAHILQRNQANYSKDLYTYHLLRPAVGNGLVTNDGAGWLAQRRLVQPAFHRERIRVMAAEIDGATARMLDRWAEQASVGAPVDVAEEMLRVTLEIVGRVLFGVDLNSEAAAAGRAFRDINELITSYVHMPLLSAPGAPPASLPSSGPAYPAPGFGDRDARQPGPTSCRRTPPARGRSKRRPVDTAPGRRVRAGHVRSASA